jgi:hypothetical protein
MKMKKIAFLILCCLSLHIKQVIAATCTATDSSGCIEYTEFLPDPYVSTSANTKLNTVDYYNIKNAVDRLKAIKLPNAKRVLKFKSNAIYNPAYNINAPAIAQPTPLIDLTDESLPFIVDGQNATINLSTDLIMALNYKTNNATYMNLKVDYAHPNFTQGTITSINSADSTIDVTLDASFISSPPNPDFLNQDLNWANSAIYRLNPVTNKYEYTMLELQIGRVDLVNLATHKYKLHIKPNKQGQPDPDLAKLIINDKITFRRDKDTIEGHMFTVSSSGNITFKNVSVYNTRKWAFGGLYNTGTIIHDGVRIEPTPNTSRLTSGIAGGIIYSSGGRGKLIIKNSYITANFDDAINIGTHLDSAHYLNTSNQEVPYTLDVAAINPNNPSEKFRILTKDNLSNTPADTLYLRGLSGRNNLINTWVSQQLWEDDELAVIQYGALKPNVRILKGMIKVKSVTSDSPDARLRKVEITNLDGSTANLPYVIADEADIPLYSGGTNILGSLSSTNYSPVMMTRFFNLTTSHPRSLIVNNLIENKVRSGILVRGNNIGVVGNTIRNVGGYGISGENGYTSEEGLWSYRSDYSSNKILNTGLQSINIGMAVPGGIYNPYTRTGIPSAMTFITNNYIKDSPIGLLHMNINDIYYARNTYLAPTTGGQEVKGQEVNRSETDFEVTSSLVSNLPENITTPITHKPIFKVTLGGSNLYYVTSTTACRIPSIAFLTANWGSNTSNLISVVPQAYATQTNEIDNLPAGRTYVNNCQTGESIYRDSQGNVYRKVRDEALCKFADDNDFKISTGLNLTEKSSLLLLTAPSSVVPTCKL